MLGLNLLVLRCADLAACRAFYEALGLAFAAEKHGSGPEHLACADGAGALELYPAGSEPPDRAGLGFHVPDLDATRGRLLALGFAAGPVRAGPRGRSFVARDPDGRRVEISALTAP